MSRLGRIIANGDKRRPRGLELLLNLFQNGPLLALRQGAKNVGAKDGIIYLFVPARPRAEMWIVIVPLRRIDVFAFAAPEIKNVLPFD